MRTIVVAVAVAVVAAAAIPARAQRWRDDTATTIGTTAEWTNKVELADVDGDGWLDVLLANGRSYQTPGTPEASRVFRNTAMWSGAPPFFEEITAQVFGTATGHARVIKVRDVDADGDADIFVGNTYGDASRLYRRDATGWTDVTATQLPDLQPWVGDADFGDVDGDADLDLVLADWGTTISAGAPPRLYLNDGAGTFTAAPAGQMPATAVRWSWELDLADVDGDWDLDLLVASKLGARTVLYRNDGAGTFTDDAGGLPSFTNNYETELMDIDGDGDLDLVTLNDGSNLRDHVLVNTGGQFVDETATRLAGAANPSEDDNMAAFVDIDGDRDADFLVGSLSGPDRLLVNDGTGVFTVSTTDVPGSTPGTLGIAIGDVDGDARPDLLMGQGELAFADHLYRATTTVPADVAAPLVYLQQIDETGVRVAARVLDGESPAGALDYTEVALEYDGDAEGSAPMTWYGEFLWRGELPAPGSYSYRVCATDRAGNRDCSNPKLTAGGGDVAPGNDAGTGAPDAGQPIDCPNGQTCEGTGCCDTGSSPGRAALPIALVALALLRRRRVRTGS
jgi:hypothetical protein